MELQTSCQTSAMPLFHLFFAKYGKMPIYYKFMSLIKSNNGTNG